MKICEHGPRASAVGRRDFLKMGASGSALAMTALSSPAAFADIDTGHTGSIDIHSHWMPEVYANALNQLRPGIASTANPLDHDLEKRRQWMDKHNVKMVALTLSGGMPWQWASAADGARLAQIINDAGAEAHAKFPDRFIAGIEIPVRDKDEEVTDMLVALARRCDEGELDQEVVKKIRKLLEEDHEK